MGESSYVASLINLYKDGVTPEDEDNILVEQALTEHDSIIMACEACEDLNDSMASLETYNIALESKANISVNISLTQSVKEKFKVFIDKIWQALKDFFYSVFHFFESKILKVDNKYLHDNIQKITAYFNSSETYACKMHIYTILNPTENFINDAAIIKTTVPELCKEIDGLINKLYSNMNNFNTARYALGADGYDIEIKSLKKKIIESLAPAGYNVNAVSTTNISKVLKLKYFGSENAETVEQPINDVIKSADIFSAIISDNAYNDFKDMYKTTKRSISECQKNINEFNKDVRSDKISYALIKMHMGGYKECLTMVLYEVIAYWNLYHTIRKDVISAANAIINR